jgi:hypothetical protein
MSSKLHLPLTQIGSIKHMQNDMPEIKLINRSGARLNREEVSQLLKSFDHFA